MRPGGMVRLNETDETPRYLGPSSGISMTRLLMEEAKKYTESKRIADLIPELRERRVDRLNRMQSVVSMGGSISGPPGRKKSYPMVSAYPATGLPSRQIADKLVEVFHQRGVFLVSLLAGDPVLTTGQRNTSRPYYTRRPLHKISMRCSKATRIHTKTSLFAWLWRRVCRS